MSNWSRDIDFHCTFGLWPFKKSLDIGPNGFLWCDELFPLRSITRVRWGVDQKRGGIFPKRDYLATFGTADREFTIRTKQKDFYEHLTTRYWRAVGVRLLREMTDGLACGRRYNFGTFDVADDGIYLIDKSLLGAKSETFMKWSELRWGVFNGNICFAPASDPSKYIAGASFLWVDNAQVLGVAMEILKRVGGKSASAAARRESL